MRPNNSQNGVVLPLVLLILLSVSAAVVATLYSVYIGQFSSRAERSSAMALQAAQTGLDKYRTIIFNQARYDLKEASDVTSWKGDEWLIELTTGNVYGPACNPLILGFPAPIEAGDDFDYFLPGESASEYLDMGIKLPGSSDDEILSPGRFTVSLSIANLASASILDSSGFVLTGLPEGEDPDTFVPIVPYPTARLNQTILVNNASLMSNALITDNLSSSGKGLQVMGPAYIEGSSSLTIGNLDGSQNNQAASGDLVLLDTWPRINNGEAEENEPDEIVFYPARPWDRNSDKPGDPNGLGNLSASLSEYDPVSLCTRLRMPNGSLGSSPDDYSSLAEITGVHVGDGLTDINHPFGMRPGLATAYDLKSNSTGNGGPSATVELSIPTGLAKYYSSKNISNEQNQEVVSDLKGGKQDRKIADDNPAPDGIVISYEWLRVNKDGNKTEYYVQHQGMDDGEVDACTGGTKFTHPDYDTSSDTNASLIQPPTTCAQSKCLPCAIEIPLQYPTTGEPDSQVIKDSGDIVWPTYDKDGNLVRGTGNINKADSQKRIPQFNMAESFQCIHQEDDSSGDTDKWTGMKWDHDKKILEVRGPVTLEGIELPLKDAGDTVTILGDGLLTLREREIRLIADHQSYEVKAKTCHGLDTSLNPCSCDYDEIVAKSDISLPTSTGDESGSAQGSISDPKTIESYYFALFKHGGKAGYEGSSDNEFKQVLPSLVLPRTYQDPESDDEADQYLFTFPLRPASSVPVVVSDPKYPNELADNHIYAGIIYHDNELKIKGNAAIVGRVMAPKVTVEGSGGAQIFGVSGYEYHLNTDFEDWLNAKEGANLDDVVVKNLPVLNIVSQTREKTQ